MIDARERFLRKAEPVTECGCWLWTGAGDDYGHISYQGNKFAKAHRVAWSLFRGLIPHGVQVLHRCNVSLCVNPDHLYLGSQRDNMLDRARAGRNPASKLSAGQVRQIRALLPTHASKDLACMFGVGSSAIRRIRRRETYRWLE